MIYTVVVESYLWRKKTQHFIALFKFFFFKNRSLCMNQNSKCHPYPFSCPVKKLMIHSRLSITNLLDYRIPTKMLLRRRDYWCSIQPVDKLLRQFNLWVLLYFCCVGFCFSRTGKGFLCKRKLKRGKSQEHTLVKTCKLPYSLQALTKLKYEKPWSNCTQI